MANLLLIRDLCEINKIKIRELASRIGKDESTIQSMIRAGSTNTKTLEAIAEVFNVSPGIFFDNPSENNTGTNLNKEEEIAYLKKLLEEKERLIQVLLNKKQLFKNISMPQYTKMFTYDLEIIIFNNKKQINITCLRTYFGQVNL